jgi:hypothetical protein
MNVQLKETPFTPPLRPLFALVQASEMSLTSPVFLVRGLLETSALALMFGDPGCGKSFLALHMACCVATGRDFFRLPVKQGPVIYLAGEGHGGLLRRIKAWEKETAVSLDGAPLFFSKVPARLLDANHADAVASAVDMVAGREGNPLLIVIDTVARSFAGGDENSTKDMSEFVAAVDAIKARYEGCTALLVHHSGHADKLRSRGSMALKGALDAEYRVSKTGDAAVSLFNTKMKDAPPPVAMHFTLQDVVLGLDGDGREYGSAVLVATEGSGQVREKKLSAGMKLGLDSLLQAKRDFKHCNDPSVGIDVEAWRPHFYSGHTGDSPQAKRKAFERARKDLLAAGHLAVTKDVYRILDLPEGHRTAFLINRQRPEADRTDRTEAGHDPTSPGSAAGQTGQASIDASFVLPDKGSEDLQAEQNENALPDDIHDEDVAPRASRLPADLEDFA